jgi:hypothetical protein
MLDEELDENKRNPAYYTGIPAGEKSEREKAFTSRAKLSSKDPKAYRDFETDKTPSGEPRKTKTSKWTKKAADMGYGPKGESAMEEVFDLDEDVLREFIEECVAEVLLDEAKKGKRTNVTAALKNKAEKSGAPMGVLRAIYNKGLAAWRTGHRPGASAHQWAMARVNSVLAGGPARKVDDAQWQQIKKARGKKKKKK